MCQVHDEPVRSFGARLHSQAGNTSGCCYQIADPDIQLDLFSNKNQDMTLEEEFQLAEAKESGNWLASRLLDSHAVEAASIIGTF